LREGYDNYQGGVMRRSDTSLREASWRIGNLEELDPDAGHGSIGEIIR